MENQEEVCCAVEAHQPLRRWKNREIIAVSNHWNHGHPLVTTVCKVQKSSINIKRNFTCSKLVGKLGPSLTTRYHHTSSLVSRRASVLTWMELRGCMRSFRRLLLHRISAQEKPVTTLKHEGRKCRMQNHHELSLARVLTHIDH